jgi:hypothetical protein
MIPSPEMNPIMTDEPRTLLFAPEEDESMFLNYSEIRKKI